MGMSLSQTRRADWGYKILSRVVLISAFVVILWDFVKTQEMIYRLNSVNVAGFSLSVIGVSIRVVAIRTLAKYFSTNLETMQDHKLVKHGIYRHIRHPAYLGTTLFSLGIALIFSSLYGFLLMLGLFPCYLFRIKIEESMLLEKFGDEYRNYKKKTKKIIPLIY